MTSDDPTGLNLYTLLTYTHRNLLSGHLYKYRVKAKNLMGWGAYSSVFSFVPRVVPFKPWFAPRDRLAPYKTRSILSIEFDAVLETGGEPILEYKVYIDDGLDSDNFVPYTSGTSLQFSTSPFTTAGTLTLVTGRIYKLKYSATNVAGEGPLSEEVSILLAEVPSAPVDLRRIAI